VKQRIVDILWQEIAANGVSDAFMLSGGGIMYLVDALGRSTVNHICCHHEQAASIAAQSYAMAKNDLGVCLITTGPGGTNALTGCAAAFMDSTPVLFLSGQVKTADSASLRGVRQFGAQENDIVSMAAPVTKYAVLVEDLTMALYELQKAIFLAMHGRRGPVWVDVPLDIQSAEVDASDLRCFSPSDLDLAEYPDVKAQLSPDNAAIESSVQKTVEFLAAAKRPLLLAGHGVPASGSESLLRDLATRLGIPVVATWRAMEVFDHEDPLFFGSPGLQAVRSSNIITQGADFLLVLGSRLDNMITAFSEERFALRAQKVIVDLDSKEIDKLAMPEVTPVVCDVGEFLRRLNETLPSRPKQDIAPWLAFCTEMKARFPLLAEKQDRPSPLVDLYRAADAVAAQSNPDDALVISSTSRCNTAGHLAMRRKQGQKSVSSMGMGSMGFALPSVVGAWAATGRGRVLMLEGDGSLQLNLQELETVSCHAIDAKLFIFSNNGYAAIATMQDRNFDGIHVGSDPDSGVTMPSLKKLAKAYNMSYMRIASNDEIVEGVRRAMDTPGAVICEVVGDIAFDEIPKCISSVNAEGVRVSAALENPYPFLPEEEIETLFARLER